MRRKAPHGAKRLLASLPQLQSLDVVARDLHAPRTARNADLSHDLQVRADAGVEPVELDQQNRLRILWIARRIDRRLDHTDRRTIHELKRGWNDSRCDDGRGHARRFVHRHEVGEQRAHGLRFLRQVEGDGESETEAPFGADERPAQIVSVVLAEFASQLDDLTARQNDGYRQDVIERNSVLEAVRAARVFSHVAADGAGRFTRRIRRVQKAVRRDVLVESKVDDSRLDRRATILDVERDYLFQAM